MNNLMLKLRLLFIIFVVLLGGVLIYQKAPSENFEDGQGVRVEKEATQSNQEADEKDLIQQELPPLLKVPKASETKPIEPKKEVSAPAPLRVTPPPPTPEPEPRPASLLTQTGIILQTNLQRQENSLGFFKGDASLNAMAGKKADDMCEKQYFAHVSPSGVGVADLADSFGYDYLSVGENLALGSFASDQAVVLAWMNSPGHRANILNSKFTEIGVGVARCVFEGRSTWLAVQHFGKPASDCPKPDAALSRSIDENKLQLADMRDRLVILKSEIEASDPDTDPDYNTKVGTYNSLVKEYNGFIGETRILINQYNNQIAVFNACASA